MQYFVYCKLADALIREELVTALRRIAPSVLPAEDLIFIEGMPEPRLERIVTCMQEYLSLLTLEKADIIYIFYPHDDREMWMYPLKRKDRIRIRRWVNPSP